MTLHHIHCTEALALYFRQVLQAPDTIGPHADILGAEHEAASDWTVRSICAAGDRSSLRTGRIFTFTR